MRALIPAFSQREKENRYEHKNGCDCSPGRQWDDDWGLAWARLGPYSNPVQMRDRPKAHHVASSNAKRAMLQAW